MKIGIRNQPSPIGHEMQDWAHEKAWDVCPSSGPRFLAPSACPILTHTFQVGLAKTTLHTSRSLPNPICLGISALVALILLEKFWSSPGPSLKDEGDLALPNNILPPPSLRGGHPLVAIGSQRSRVGSLGSGPLNVGDLSVERKIHESETKGSDERPARAHPREPRLS